MTKSGKTGQVRVGLGLIFGSDVFTLILGNASFGK